MDIHIWISVYGYPYMDIHIWISIYGYPYMDIQIWISIYGYPYMDIHIWISARQIPVHKCPPDLRVLLWGPSYGIPQGTYTTTQVWG